MPHVVKRDSYFWTIALQTFAVNFFLGGFGPAQPLLRADQHTSLTIAGLHGTAMGFASICAGLLNPHLAHRFGRDNTAWLGLGIFSIGIAVIVFSPPVQITILGSLIAGFGTSTVINNFVTSLNKHYGKSAPFAVMQANGIGSMGYIFGTLTIGTIANLNRSHWRLGLLVILPIVAYLYFIRRDKSLSEHVPGEHGPQKGKLSIKYWIAWVGFVAVISSEFATSFWAAALVRDRTNASPAISTLAIVALGSGMAIGRWYGAQTLKNFEPDTQLKIFIATQFLGFGILWFSHNLTLSITAILIVGLGISSQFALSSIRLIGLSDGRPDLAIGKSSMAAGLAIGGAPFALGVLGDHLGISRAYMLVPALILIAYFIVQFIPSHVHADDEL